ncbi:hypothetical protein EON65_08355 [archaeon]|nr:MAG: hypothetical protein EON65_08355 [archaeon]
MGIKGLLPLLCSISRRVHIATLRGKAVGVDARSWLYKAAMACPKEVANGNTPAAFVAFLKKRVELLTNAGITDVIYVFDGCECKAKQLENSARRRVRVANFDSAKKCEDEGDDDEADKLYRRGIKITFDHVQAFINILKEKQLAFMVAPYEADAQLAYFSRISAIDIVVSEDSDMLVYGCKTVLFKLDSQGEGDMMQLGDIKENKALSFSSWTNEQFKLFCCLAGCDYVESLPRVGIKTAYHIAFKCLTLDVLLAYVRSHYHATPDYCQRLTLAYYTFCHQLVFCPVKNCIVPLSPVGEGTIVQKDFMGKEIPSAHLEDLIRGRIDPTTLMSDMQQQGITNMEIESVSSITDVWKLETAGGGVGDSPGKHRTTWITPAAEAVPSSVSRIHKKKGKNEGVNVSNAPFVPPDLLNYISYESPLVSTKMQRIRLKEPAPLPLAHLQEHQDSTIPMECGEHTEYAHNTVNDLPIRRHAVPATKAHVAKSQSHYVPTSHYCFFDADTYDAADKLLDSTDMYLTCVLQDRRFEGANDLRKSHHFVSRNEQPTISSMIDRDLYQVAESKRHRIAHLLGSSEW